MKPVLIFTNPGAKRSSFHGGREMEIIVDASFGMGEKAVLSSIIANPSRSLQGDDYKCMYMTAVPEWHYPSSFFSWAGEDNW